MIANTTKGTLLAFAAYGAYACSDAFVKSMAGTFSIFEIGLAVTLFAVLPFIVIKPGSEKWSSMWQMNNPKIVHLRAISGLFGGISGFYAFTHLPFAEAYALIFLVPAFTTLIAVIVMGEQVGWRRWSAVAIGFIGVLIVIRPGFKEIQLGHLAGLGCAFFGAITINALRRISGTEKRVSIIGMVAIYAFIANLILAYPTLKLPDFNGLILMAGAGLLSGIAQLCIIKASTIIPANRIAPTQYSQLIWAISIGFLVFAEIPDHYTFIGLAIIAASGIMIFLREEKRLGPRKKITLFRNRL